jgi:hypothetical protein
VHTTAPGANIVYVGAKNCFERPLNNTLRTLVDGHLADVITNSDGDPGGDLLDSATDWAATDNILLMAAGTGISVMFSSGDDGDEFTTVGQVTPDYPASSPFADRDRRHHAADRQARTAARRVRLVHGAQLALQLDRDQRGRVRGRSARPVAACRSRARRRIRRRHELRVYAALVAGGRGPDQAVGAARPTPMRVVPDISMDADPATGMLVGETQTFPNDVYYDQYRTGGTSVFSPLFVGGDRSSRPDAGQAAWVPQPDALLAVWQLPSRVRRVTGRQAGPIALGLRELD